MAVHKRLYNRQWYRERYSFLSLPENALCVYCKRRNLLVSAQQVDHITPHRGDLDLFWDKSNWQPLCNSCAGEKSARERGFYRTGKPVHPKGCGVDGLPIDPNHPWNK